MTKDDSPLGATPTADGVRFAVWSHGAKKIWVSLFDREGERETHRVPLTRSANGVFLSHLPGLKEGQRYGFRAEGDYDPGKGLWFDPDKLLADPYAVEIDRPYRYDFRLAALRGRAGDTAPLMPKSIVRDLPEVIQKTPVFQPGGLIYELQVKAFTWLHPDIPEGLRGTVAALAHPAIIRHLKKLRVSAIELMPIAAWIDEGRLQSLGLINAWGYNPVTFMALDPRLCPGGAAELRDTVAALRAEGIGVILDVVFNHTGEGDRMGPTLSLRGLDANAYYRSRRGKLVNETGTGNTIACDHPIVRRMVLDSLRHFVRHAGVDGFRFDLAPILGRDAKGFSPHAMLLDAIRADPLLKDRVLIAEPWDIGANGYQLGSFGEPWLEWNDKYRDDVRRFWRGDAGMVGNLATRLCGSSDVFRRDGQTSTRTVNFIAAHDGFSLADTVAYKDKHNQANGEKNRDGHNENLSWNNGVEGVSADPRVLAARAGDLRALLATLFASRGAIMLTAGDEFGRTQRGNNNAYCQDNATTWLDWQNRDRGLEDFVARLAAIRSGIETDQRSPVLSEIGFLTGQPAASDVPDVQWLTETGQQMTDGDWTDPDRRRLGVILANGQAGRLAVLFNGDRRSAAFQLPQRDGLRWRHVPTGAAERRIDDSLAVDGRTVEFAKEVPA